MSAANPYRALPAVDELAGSLGDRLPWPVRVDIARASLDQARRDLGSGQDVDVKGMAGRLAKALEASSDRRVINATGVLLHTNLGRAPWSIRAVDRAREAAGGYSNLELDLGTGERGRRGGYSAALLRSLTGAEDALVVNNNAAALLLALASLAAGRSVPVARGELIEIGGAYRLPDVVATSGAILVEVGTTNRTRVGDYETALQLQDCAAILKVHPSNYRIEGFVEEAGFEELASLAAAHEIPLIHDIGSGLLDAGAPWLDGDPPAWVRGEPAARQSLHAGASLVLFSGDKLLGGPQSGIAVGDHSVVERMRRHPLARALRPDAVTLAALAATLEAYAEGSAAGIPFWWMATRPFESLLERVTRLASLVGGHVGEGESAIGAGSAPGSGIRTPLVTIDGGEQAYQCLLGSNPPILARRVEGTLVIDLRTVEEGDDGLIARALLECR